ncbi:hypothetical protein HELRODRAFT_160818 [Helobdella robusta]|uniref:Apple domain-containing protein n=1 Tax=Helobdella robusta TaxID=6412 RepID=T1EQR8_HELRO|nr:hypothetical protein HELRODRAFT_160818 [Helobdella robusta]ESO06628.1 hypothetical protein HELRODRAFT_160818 [Helobdella robusta]
MKIAIILLCSMLVAVYCEDEAAQPPRDQGGCWSEVKGNVLKDENLQVKKEGSNAQECKQLCIDTDDCFIAQLKDGVCSLNTIPYEWVPGNDDGAILVQYLHACPTEGDKPEEEPVVDDE